MKKTITASCLVLVMFASMSLTTSAQIRIPRIPRPRPNQPTQPSAPTSTQPSSTTPDEGGRESVTQPPAPSRTTGGGNYVDDGYTWFEAVATNDPEVKHKNVSTGWTVKSSIRLMGVYPKRSGIKVVVSRAGGALVVTTRCDAGSYNIPPNPADVSFIYIDGCWKNETTTKETGKFDVEVFAVDGLSNAETSVRKYKIEVLKIDRVNAQVGKLSAPDVPHYIISRHAEAPVSFLYLRRAGAYPYIMSGGGQRHDTNQVEIFYNLSPDQAARPIPYGYVRCSVDGKRLQLPDRGTQTDIAVSDPVREFEKIYTDRIAAQYKVGPEYKDDIGFRLVRLTLPVSYGGNRSNFLNMNEHPGKWECSLMYNGATWRTWRWAIGRDGMPVKHPEQNGNINLYDNTVLIDTEIPAGGTALDKRLAPVSLTEGFFYGQPWTSAEGKAMAARVPSKGNPLPVPSNRVK